MIAMQLISRAMKEPEQGSLKSLLGDVVNFYVLPCQECNTNKKKVKYGHAPMQQYRANAA